MLPEPLQSLLTVLPASVGQQPEGRLRDPPEREEEEEAEERRDSGHEPPVEESAQAVAGQHPNTNHQAEQGQEPSPSLEGAGEMNMSWRHSLNIYRVNQNSVSSYSGLGFDDD